MELKHNCLLALPTIHKIQIGPAQLTAQRIHFSFLSKSISFKWTRSRPDSFTIPALLLSMIYIIKPFKASLSSNKAIPENKSQNYARNSKQGTSFNLQSKSSLTRIGFRFHSKPSCTIPGYGEQTEMFSETAARNHTQFIMPLVKMSSRVKLKSFDLQHGLCHLLWSL